MKRLVVDIDGVACAHAYAICSWINEKYDLNTCEADVAEWDHDFGPITFVEAVRECYARPSFIINMPVTDGFLLFYEKASQHLDVSFATARKELCHDATRQWIMDNFNSSAVKFLSSKADLDYDYLIDDYPGEIIASAEKLRQSFLLKKPWNDNCDVRKSLSSYPSACIVNHYDDIWEIISRQIGIKNG